MPRTFLLTAVAALVLHPAAFAQDDKETAVKSRIVSLSLFKNGLAVVKREVKVDGAGVYRLDRVPEAIHGTFWIESNAPVEASVKTRDVELADDQLPEGSLQEIFAGKKVTVSFTGAKSPPATGTVVKVAPRSREDRPSATTDRFLVLKTAKGLLYVSAGEIAAIETEEAGGKATRRQAALLLTIGKTEKAPSVFISYLAHGLAWAPSYRLDVSDPKTMDIEMAAVLRNEMADFADAEVSLISGYPSVEFAQVASPLQAHATWQRFFQEIAGGGDRYDHSILTQKLLANTVAPIRRPTLGAVPEGEGVDLHFEPIGKRSLKDGEALSLTVGKNTTDYERIVEWTVNRAGFDYGLREAGKDDMWDTLAFKNPFKFPLTTAPAMIVEKGRFNGERTCYWTNVGEETRVKVTRSLSIRTASSEELDKSRPLERVAVGRRDYSRIYLKGELTLNNHRKETVKVWISYNVRGQVLDTEGDPRITLQPGSLTDVNPMNQVVWLVTLKSGEEKRVRYGYSTLVDR
ncbi:MAG: hypothetical protein U0793_16245 [Gemmataceae bacterium]